MTFHRSFSAAALAAAMLLLASPPAAAGGPAQVIAEAPGLAPIPAGGPPAAPEFLYGLVPSQLTPAGERLFFVADDRAHGAELWVSDGTAAGTRRVTDVCPGACSAAPSIQGVLAGEVYFFAHDPEHGRELWASDGTAGGTRRIRDLCPGACDASPEVQWWNPEPFVEAVDGAVLGGRLLFHATGANGPALFATDGHDVERLLGASMLTDLVVSGDRMMFLDFRLVLGITDGTRAGTRFVGSYCGPSTPANSAAWDFTPHAGGWGFLSQCGAVPEVRFNYLGPDGELFSSEPFADAILTSVDTTVEDELYVISKDHQGRTRLWVFVPGQGLRLNAETSGTRVEPSAGWNGSLYTGVVDRSDPGDHPVSAAIEKLHINGAGLTITPSPAVADSFLPLDDRLLALAHAPTQPFVWDLWSTRGELDTSRRVHSFRSAATGPDGAIWRHLPPEMEVAGDVLFVAADGADGRKLWALPLALLDGPCVPAEDSLCFGGGRFEARVRWRNQHTGAAVEDRPVGDGLSIPETADAGFFWFFRPSNVELLVKVLDGTAVNGNHWVFHGPMTDVEYWLQVHDFTADLTRTYRKLPTLLCGGFDVGFFRDVPRTTPPATAAWTAVSVPVPAAPAAETAAEATCTASDTALCLGGRFRVEVTFEDVYNQPGVEQTAHAAPETADSGAFWFFRPGNLEVLVKVLDGTPVNGHFWVFAGSITSLPFEVHVTDTLTGATWSGEKTTQQPCGIADTEALP